MQRTFSIITTSKGRVEHLKRSLPKMIGQPSTEVIVVDFSCPQGTGDFVRAHFPQARVVAVDGEPHFSNWKARNAGASAASSDVLVFCDADTILADDAIARISDTLPEKAFGYFVRASTARFNTSGLRLASNQLRGFHAIPSADFRRVGGYDEVLRGYAAGGDTDLEERLKLISVAPCPLDPAVVASVIEHDNASRTEHHADPIAISYGAGLLYRAAKLALLRLRKRAELPLKVRRTLYRNAREAALKLGSPSDRIGLKVNLDLKPILMPRQLGYEKGTQRLSLTVEVALEGKTEVIPG